MKKAGTTIFIFLIILQSQAQDGPLRKGDLKLSAGIGLGSYIKIAGGETTFPPVTVSGEYAVQPNLTIGPVLGYTATQDRYNYPSINYHITYKLSNLLLGGNVRYYFNVSPKYELYAGGFLGYNAVTATIESKSNSSSPVSLGFDPETYSGDAGGFLYGVLIGGRYKFSNNLAAFTELGYGIAVLNIGITFSMSKK